MSSKMYFFYGTMSSAKTLRLLTTAHNFEERGITFLVIKPSIDTRDEEGFVTSRVGLKRECIMVDKDVDIFDSISEYTKILQSTFSKLEWILVDECQFLTEEQVDQLAAVVDRLDINVMCFGLRTDFRSKAFKGSKRLFEIADDIEEIKSSCSCGNKTIINARFNENNELILDGPQIMVGGNDVYKPLCRKCWSRLVENFK